MARSFGSKGRILASMLGIAVVLGMTLAQSPPPAPIVPAPTAPAPPSAFPLATPPADVADTGAGTGERFINVGLAGKKHRCRLIVAWDLPNGGSAYQVQAVDTNEMLTLVREAAAGNGTEETPVRIFRWGSRTTPPRGAPVAPPVPAPLAIAAEPMTIPMPPSANPTPNAPVVAAAPRSDDPWIVGPPAKHGEPVSETFAALRPTPPTGPVVVSTVVQATPAITTPFAPSATPFAPTVPTPVAPTTVVQATPAFTAPTAPTAVPFTPTSPVVAAVAPTPAPPTIVAPRLASEHFNEWKLGQVIPTPTAPVAPTIPTPVATAPAIPPAAPIAAADVSPFASPKPQTAQASVAPVAPPVRVAPIVAQRVPQPQPQAPVQVAQAAPEVQPPPIERIDGVRRVQPVPATDPVYPPHGANAPQLQPGQIPYTPLVPDPAPGTPLVPTQAPNVPFQPNSPYQVPTADVIVTPSMVSQAPSASATPMPEAQGPIVAAPHFPEPTVPVGPPTPVADRPSRRPGHHQRAQPSLPLIINGPNARRKLRFRPRRSLRCRSRKRRRLPSPRRCRRQRRI